MMEKIEEEILFLEASSPEELDKSLMSLSQEGAAGKWRPAALSISGPKVIVRRFHLTDVPPKDVKHYLQSEALELTSLTSDDIELDYKITHTDEHNVKGVYACMPKKDLEEYLMVLDDKELNPLLATEHFLACVNALCQQEKIGQGRVGFLLFSPGKVINLFVSNNRECDLLRKIPYEDFGEAQKEIVQSLRSASAKGWPKHYDIIYYTGPFEDIDALKSAVKKIFKTELEECSVVYNPRAFLSEEGQYSLNLLNKHAFTLRQSRAIRMGMNIVLGLCLLNAAVTGLQLALKGRTIAKIKSSYQASEYQRAVELSKEIKK
ncbi:MAG: hypothetical protein JW847_00520 [Candidatus Omnitrophica bacterium]|nr:hypothetical protein [Candidatus Omnitrophota bacterium]